SVIAQQGASLHDVSLGKAAELFFDLNLGLLPYLPVAVLALVAGIVACAMRRSFRTPVMAAAVLVAMALLGPATTNWNHGTTGPSPYAGWVVPLLSPRL